MLVVENVHDSTCSNNHVHGAIAIHVCKRNGSPVFRQLGFEMQIVSFSLVVKKHLILVIGACKEDVCTQRNSGRLELKQRNYFFVHVAPARQSPSKSTKAEECGVLKRHALSRLAGSLKIRVGGHFACQTCLLRFQRTLCINCLDLRRSGPLVICFSTLGG